jgi:hypothetical protein
MSSDPPKPGKTEEFLAFAARLRRDEVAASLAREGMLVETMMLERTGDGDFVVFYTRARDLAAANAA